MFFESLTSLPPANLINASYSLPFMNLVNFYKLWAIILILLHSGARFAGSFFGNHDSWNTKADMTLFSREEILNLFALFKIEFFEEEEQEGTDSEGNIKHWHIFHIVAKKS